MATSPNRTLHSLTRATENLAVARERRDELIARASKQGASRRQVAAASGLTPGRIQQIIGAMRKAGLMAMLLALMLGGSASAATVIDGRAVYQRWADRATVPTPDATLRVVETECPFQSAHACTTEPGDTIWIANAFVPRTTFLHELGHQFDWRVLSDADRAQITALMGMSGDWHSRDLSWGDRPVEMYADAYSMCARREWRRGTWRLPRFEPLPAELSPRGHREVCDVIRTAYRR